MSIKCDKCSYLMTKSEVAGYLTCEMYTIFKTLILPVLLARYAMKGIKKESDGWIVGILNKCEIKCHVCKEYIGWSNAKTKKGDPA
jgi:hypothetical protein